MCKDDDIILSLLNPTLDLDDNAKPALRCPFCMDEIRVFSSAGDLPHLFIIFTGYCLRQSSVLPYHLTTAYSQSPTVPPTGRQLHLFSFLPTANTTNHFPSFSSFLIYLTNAPSTITFTLVWSQNPSFAPSFCFRFCHLSLSLSRGDSLL